MSDIMNMASDFLKDEMLERIMPLIKKQLPSTEKSIKDFLSGKEDGVRKLVVIDLCEIGNKKDEVACFVLNSSVTSVEIDKGSENKAVIDSYSASEWMEKIMSGNLLKS